MPFSPDLKMLAVSGFCLALSACASVSPAAMARLAALDPLAADPAQISVAARLPQALKLRTGDLVMIVRSNGSAADSINETFKLEVADAKPGDAGVIIPEDGEHLQVARVAESDLDRLRLTQAKARAIKAAGGSRGKGSMTVGAQGGCKTGEPQSGVPLLNIYMQTERQGDWFPVVGNLDIAKALGADMMAKIPACS